MTVVKDIQYSTFFRICKIDMAVVSSGRRNGVAPIQTIQRIAFESVGRRPHGERMTAMDSNNIRVGGGVPAWGGVSPRTVSPEVRTESRAIAAPADRVEMSGASALEPALPSCVRPAPGSVDTSAPPVASASSTASSSAQEVSGTPVRGATFAYPLTVLAQLDDVNPLERVGESGVQPSARGLSLVGLGNAHDFLANPSRMYLGV